MGVLEHYMTLMLGNDHTEELARKTGWNFTEEARLLPPYDECLTPNHYLVINLIAYNCRGGS